MIITQTFWKDIGKFKPNTSKLLLPKEERVFNLEFLSSKMLLKHI